MLEFIRGVVRPGLTFIGFVALTVGFLRDKVAGDIYVPMVSMMVAWWFATRKDGKG